jgi:hypothetical protein
MYIAINEEKSMRVLVSMVLSLAFCSAVLVAASSAKIFVTSEQALSMARFIVGN